MSDLNWERISLGIIVEAGNAKSEAMEALYAAKKGDFELAAAKLKAADKAVGEASRNHFDVISKEAAGEQLEYKVLFIHAEDQLLTTQTLLTLVGEMVEMYRNFMPKGKAK